MCFCITAVLYAKYNLLCTQNKYCCFIILNTEISDQSVRITYLIVLTIPLNCFSNVGNFGFKYQYTLYVLRFPENKPGPYILIFAPNNVIGLIFGEWHSFLCTTSTFICV